MAVGPDQEARDLYRMTLANDIEDRKIDSPAVRKARAPVRSSNADFRFPLQKYGIGSPEALAAEDSLYESQRLLHVALSARE